MAQQGVALRAGRGPTTWQPIDSWAHASALVRRFIEGGDLTASGETGPMWTGGNVKDATGRVVARVSYNGKVWTPAPWPASVLLFDPYAHGG